MRFLGWLRRETLPATHLVEMLTVESVTRFEVIDDAGRILVRNPCRVQLSFQDRRRTLKVFVKDAR